MKNLIHEIVFGRNGKVSGVIALSVILSIALGCNCNEKLSEIANSANTSRTSSNDSDDSAKSDAVPSNLVVEGLVKDTMVDFADAVDSGSFADLYGKASTDFQDTYTIDEMTKAFKSYTDKKKIVMPVLDKISGMDADFDSPPGIRTEQNLKILMAKGKFKTKPYNVRFDYEYVQRGGEWKLLKLVINIP